MISRIVAGDKKVVRKGSADKILINTFGSGTRIVGVPVGEQLPGIC